MNNNEKQNKENLAVIRPSWDEYFMKLAWLVAERSTCLRHHVGAVIVRDKRILTTGYNGAAAGVKDCLTLGCLRNQLNIPSGQKHEICRAIHAEQNAIIQGGYHGINIKGATLYCTHSPCILCAKMIANSGIIKVIMSEVYPDKSYEELFKEANIEFYSFQTENLSISRLK
ncbi:MAG: dCMP deaminase family protein [Endomicrobium sp.]|jgi:dCMP deaminase|nr:dCMP deaminase family protein [Endomicrobium sp.]